VKESITVKEAMKNAPKHNDTFFKVPKVFDWTDMKEKWLQLVLFQQGYHLPDSRGKF
jgi:hypothetical protein